MSSVARPPGAYIASAKLRAAIIQVLHSRHDFVWEPADVHCKVMALGTLEKVKRILADLQVLGMLEIERRGSRLAPSRYRLAAERRTA